MRYSLLIEYDGSNYSGWQIQKAQKTVQGEIEKALEVILKTKTGIIGAGRTDSGVHAKGQVAHFDSESDLVLEQFHRSLNGLLSKDIRIKRCNVEEDDFHARYGAKERKYSYYISKNPTAIYRLYSWQLNYKFDIIQMQKAANKILSKHNFKSFCRNISEVSHHYCTINSISWINKDSIVKFEIAADRYLHGMIRALVGTFVDIGMGKLTIDDFMRILDAKDRTKASQAAPARGLFLEQVKY
jgi:tRNA pseudouridine38-40 synthase